jgi:hypothetical protein
MYNMTPLPQREVAEQVGLQGGRKEEALEEEEAGQDSGFTSVTFTQG